MTKKPCHRCTNEYIVPVVSKRMTNFEIFQTAGLVRSGRGSPAQARELIAQFVATSFDQAGPSRALISFIRDSLSEFLEDEKTLESSFRLKQANRGRPTADETRSKSLAADMLRRRVVEDRSFEDAAAETAETMNSNRSSVCTAFATFGFEAMFLLQQCKPPLIDLANPQQTARLERIFPGFVLPLS